MSGGHNPVGARDRFGFVVGGITSKIANMLDRGQTTDAIEKAGFARQQIHSVKYQLKKRKEEMAKPNGAAPDANETPATDGEKYDKYGFRLGTIRAKMAELLDGGMEPKQVAETLKIASNGVYAVRRKMEAQRGGQNNLPAVIKSGTLTKSKRGQPTTAELFGMDADVIELIVHPRGGGESVRTFASVDVFPAIYARVLKITGIKP